jgi:hypothetical protein
METNSGKSDAAVDCLFQLSLHVSRGHPCRVSTANRLPMLAKVSLW